MVYAAYLLENTILELSRVGHSHPIFKPHRGVFAAFPKQNGKCPTNSRVGMGTFGSDRAINSHTKHLSHQYLVRIAIFLSNIKQVCKPSGTLQR